MNLDARLTAQLAALAAGVSKQTFNYWRTSGKVLQGDDGMYRYGDVLAAEAATRRSALSHRGPRPTTGRTSWASLNVNSGQASFAN